ncbi:MAG: DUF2157 domain-containing protein [Candidatus Omnitrophica bacterium]|nr:hypothetical protein [bacterium]NUN96874.1 DUF2157 domain-containing protein [Candidatus Omnitrophota bacterium]
MAEQPDEQHQPTRRDMETVLFIGCFLVFFAVATLCGSFWDMSFRARFVNTVAGLVLLSIGVGALLWARSMKRRIK